MLRIVQVGMGGWGRDWAKHVLQPDNQIALLACVDATPLHWRWRAELGPQTHDYFENLADALSATDAETVLITANLPGHVPLAMEAVPRAGKHVLLEKPFAPSVAEAQQVVEFAAERNLKLMISQNYRFFPAVQAVRELVRSGDLAKSALFRSISVDMQIRRSARGISTTRCTSRFWLTWLSTIST